MRIVIIGGGAAGLAAACMLCQNGEKPLILEKQSRVGRKLLSTGNGRCNFTNLNASVNDYHGNRKMIKTVLDGYSPWDVMDFFESIGVESSADDEGRVYPLSNQAAGVLDALRMFAEENGCEIRTDSPVTEITKKGKKLSIKVDAGQNEIADIVIIACGGLAAPKLGAGADGYRLLQSFGHTITPRYPAIAALKTPPEFVRGLKGIRMSGSIELFSEDRSIRREEGEILFSETGISGIAAMQMARDVNLLLAKRKKISVVLNFMPDAQKGCLRRRAEQLPKRCMEDFLSGIVPKRLGQSLVAAAGISPMSIKAAELSATQLDRLEQQLTGREIPVVGTMSFENAQVTCGGVPMNEFDPVTLESLNAAGVFAVGEVLDVDGDCGGFNLHWAWACAHAVTQAIVNGK